MILFIWHPRRGKQWEQTAELAVRDYEWGQSGYKGEAWRNSLGCWTGPRSCVQRVQECMLVSKLIPKRAQTKKYELYCMRIYSINKLLSKSRKKSWVNLTKKNSYFGSQMKPVCRPNPTLEIPIHILWVGQIVCPRQSVLKTWFDPIS